MIKRYRIFWKDGSSQDSSGVDKTTALACLGVQQDAIADVDYIKEIPRK